MAVKADTIAAVATPSGEGGIAVVRVSGPDALSIAGRVFRPARAADPTRYRGFTVHYGQFHDPTSGETLDDGLLTVFREPHSYTGEAVVELSCHGGRATTRRVLLATLAAGARLAEPGEFTRRAFLNGRLDLAQAEAVADLIRARTDSARRLARQQLEGTLSGAIHALRQELIGILAAIEVTIDFSDEVGDLDYETLLLRLQTVRQRTEALRDTAERGRILREGLRVAIVGRPNVGKSSLLNALLRTERAIVTPIAGTTRDLVEESAQIGGLSLVLVDTAGLRETADVVERIGVERAQQAAGQADVILFVLDATQGYTAEDARIATTLAAQAPEAGTRSILLVLNKMDALERAEQIEADMEKIVLPFALAGRVAVSAQTGAGLEALERMLATLAQGGNAEESTLVTSERHREALAAACVSLQEAEQTCRARLPGDFIAIDTRGALDVLGRITGETVTEEIIHRIFQDFCVGK